MFLTDTAKILTGQPMPAAGHILLFVVKAGLDRERDIFAKVKRNLRIFSSQRQYY